MELVPGYTLQPATTADIPILTDFIVSSKRQLAINRFLFRNWPATSEQRAVYEDEIRRSILDPNTSILKVIHEQCQRPVAYMELTRVAGSGAASGKDQRRESLRSRARRAILGTVDIPVLNVFYAAVEALGAPYGNYFELTYIYVEPSSRGKGIGMELLRECIDWAQWEGLPLTLNVEPNHHSWFLRRGLTDVHAVEVDLRQFAERKSGYGLYRMSRMVWPEYM